jgi:hypothetical protein
MGIHFSVRKAFVMPMMSLSVALLALNTKGATVDLVTQSKGRRKKLASSHVAIVKKEEKPLINFLNDSMKA